MLLLLLKGGYAAQVTWAEVAYQATTTISCGVGNALGNGGGAATVVVGISANVGNAVAAGSTASLSEYGARVTFAELQYRESATVSVPLSVGNAVAGGPAGATVSADLAIVSGTGNGTAAGSTAAIGSAESLAFSTGGAIANGLTAGVIVTGPLSMSVGNAVADGLRALVLPPVVEAPSATPGYATRSRYRVRVGTRWLEVDPLDPQSVRRAYDAAQEDAQDAATQDVEAPQVVAEQAVVVQPVGPDYDGLAKEARRISEEIRKVYADALQTALIARLMRERIEQDDEDDIAVLLASI